MKKNLTKLLRSGRIKPKDRMRLLVADRAMEDTTGKGLLTKADKHALSEGWTPQDSTEANEYNRFNEGWKNACYAEMDAHTTYLIATNNFLRASNLVNKIVIKSRDAKEDKTIKGSVADMATKGLLGVFDDNGQDTEDRAIDLVLNYLGLEIDQLIHLYAFELADKELQKDILRLHPNANTENSYLEQEELLYNSIKGKTKEETKELVIPAIIVSLFNSYAQDWQFENGRYFAGMPLHKILTKWADYNGVDYKEDNKDFIKVLKEKLVKTTQDKQDKNLIIGDAITKTLERWIDEGMFEKDFIPLYTSKDLETCNEEDTKLPHDELFAQWLEVKDKARQTIQELINKGDLVLEEREQEIKLNNELIKLMTGEDSKDKTIKKTTRLITGRSLYDLKGDYTFVKDFHQQAEGFKIMGALVLFLQRCSFIKEYAILLGFKDLFDRLSDTFNTNLTYSIDKWLKAFEDDVNLLRFDFLMLADDITQANFRTDKTYYMSESFIEDLWDMPLDLAKIKPNLKDIRIKTYFEKIKEQLKDDFETPYEQ